MDPTGGGGGGGGGPGAIRFAGIDGEAMKALPRGNVSPPAVLWSPPPR